MRRPDDQVNLDGLRRKLRGLTLFRLLSVTALLLAAVFVGVETLTHTDEGYDRSGLIAMVVFAIYGLSMVYAVVLWRSSTMQVLRRLAYTQIAGDVVLAGMLVLLTGGTGSAFTFFFSLTIVNSAIILYRVGALFTANCCALLFLAIGLEELSIVDIVGFLPASKLQLNDITGAVIYNLVVNGVAFYAIAFLGSYLAEQLRRSDEQLEQERIDHEELRALHEDIVTSIPNGLVTVNPNRQVTFFNRVAEEMTGLRQDDILFRDITSVFANLGPIFSNEDKLESIHEEHTSQVLRGQVTELLWTISPLRDALDRGIGHTLIFQDITEFRAMQGQVKRNEQLATLGRLASVIAHEIRNPLASISGSIQLLRSTLPVDDDDRSLMDIIGRETDGLSQWISDFLTYARPRKGELVRVDLVAMIRDVVTVLKADEKLSNIAVSISTPTDAPILADPTYLRQVIWNLLNNAVEAMPDGGDLTVEVDASTHELGRFHRLRVSDTGVGIPPELRERIFEPFFTTKETGTGLGLPTVHRIVTEHRGSIVLDTEVGRGTTFLVELPVFDPRGSSRTTVYGGMA